MTEDADALIEAGRAGLVACDWARARTCFEQAGEVSETAETLEGLGKAVYWQGDYTRALELQERAYRRYRERGDHRAAARVAVHLAQLHGLIHGDVGAVDGWVAHARRMLEADGRDCPERGWVEVFRACIAADADVREQHARVAVETGRRFDDPGLEFDGLAYLGKARIEQDAVDEGLELIDEAVAAAVGGLIDDPWAIGEIYCSLFDACEMTMDVRRAEAWLDAVDGYVERTGEMPIWAICRMHYGGVLIAAGRWEQAEQELTTATGIFHDTYRGTRFQAVRRLADLRVRQGRLEEAARLLDGLEDRPGAARPRARLALCRGEPELAAAVLERALARRERRGTLAAPDLALLVQAELAAGRRVEADRWAAELANLAGGDGPPAVRGLAALSRARLAAGVDTAASRAGYEEALVALTTAELPWERAVARLELAGVMADDRPAVARAEARTALSALRALGARQADAAARLLRELGDPGRSWRDTDGTLTARQGEVLDLLAEGLSNAEIAERLYISPRTAEHHVSNILATLGLSSRAEATAYALRRSLTGDRGAR